jgi:hypothetical protein
VSKPLLTIKPIGSVAISGTATQGQTLTATVSDDDGVTGTITYQWKRGEADIGANSATYVLVQADVGSTITVNAQYTDALSTSSETVTSSATDAVTNVNDAGSVAISGTATQGQTLTATVSDDDGVTGTITYQWKRTTNSVTTDIGTNGTSATYVLVQADVGSTITVNAQYNDDQSTAEDVTSAATAAVTNVNDAPTISGTPAATVAEDTLYSFTPTATDVDGDTLTFSITNKPDWLTFSPTTGALTGTPNNSHVGTTTGIVISVTDGTASIALAAFAIEVTNVNDAPTISGTPAATVAEDTLYSFTPAATDVDGDTLTFSITNKPDWATFSTSTGALTGTPDNSDAGTTTGIVISVTDGVASPISLASFAIAVTKLAEIHLGTQIWSASKPMVASTIVETTPTCGVGRSQAVMPP